MGFLSVLVTDLFFDFCAWAAPLIRGYTYMLSSLVLDLTRDAFALVVLLAPLIILFLVISLLDFWARVQWSTMNDFVFVVLFLSIMYVCFKIVACVVRFNTDVLCRTYYIIFSPVEEIRGESWSASTCRDARMEKEDSPMPPTQKGFHDFRTSQPYRQPRSSWDSERESDYSASKEVRTADFRNHGPREVQVERATHVYESSYVSMSPRKQSYSPSERAESSWGVDRKSDKGPDPPPGANDLWKHQLREPQAVHAPRYSSREEDSAAPTSLRKRSSPRPVPVQTRAHRQQPAHGPGPVRIEPPPRMTPSAVVLHVEKIRGPLYPYYRVFDSVGAGPLAAPPALDHHLEQQDVFVHRYREVVQGWLYTQEGWMPLAHGAVHPDLPEHRFFARAGERVRWLKVGTFKSHDRRRSEPIRIIEVQPRRTNEY
ncbi:hypothetical protein BC834DRAFT_972421 [Gloeopeniophorella convolvens]|nr:hypothetical protein BC834DRAFT_972421 [Gloeopeniophorella convolvens]